MSTVLDATEPTTIPTVMALPDLFEVVEGEIVELPAMSYYSVRVANQVCRALYRYLDGNDIGTAGVELLYRFPLPQDDTRCRRPDVSFVSYDRWPQTRPLPARGNALDVVPDLVAEVVSPSDSAEELSRKVHAYLSAGVQLVWAVYPISREVLAYRPGIRDIRVFTAAEELEAEDVLPGFRTSVAGLFPPVERVPIAANDSPSS